MSKEYRFLPKIVAGLLAIGGVGALVEHKTENQKVENPEASVGVPLLNTHEKGKEQKQIRPEQDPKFCAEHPIEAELRAHAVSIDKMHAALDDAAESIRSKRYGDTKNEEKYFAVCRDVEHWESIQKSIHFASEKTGVPERVLVAMGLIESQFDESAKRSDTKVYGPYQMTLETAQEAAKDAKECFGFPIVVKTVEDLKETKTAVRLAALRLRSLQKQYGQLGLAVIDYAGGRVSLEKKIKEAFPNVDLGEKDWKDMERHHLAERHAQKQRDELLKRMRQGRASEQDRKILSKTVDQFETAGIAYTKAKKAWNEKRQNLATTLRDAGVTAFSLHEHEKAKGSDIPDSIVYPLALDDIGENAQRHAKEARLKFEKTKKDQIQL